MNISRSFNKFKKATLAYVWTFVFVMLLNQVVFFGTCLNPTCLIAATPHVLFITVLFRTWIDRQVKSEEVKTGSAIPETELDDLQEQIQKALEAPSRGVPPSIGSIPPKNLSYLTNSEHYHYLIKSLTQVKKQLVIQSGWLSSYVIDNKFRRLLESKLKQGVEVYIGYGWQDWDGTHKPSPAAVGALKSLKILREKYPDQLFVAEYPTHEKSLVVDEQVVVYGSANWLSNRKYKNAERSVVIEDKALAETEAQRVRTLILQNKTTFYKPVTEKL